MVSPVEIFCCYARKDQQLLDVIKTHLKPLQRQGLITLWADTDIGAGADWEREIEKHLDTAEIILMLVSPDFMASDYCYSKELKHAMERHEHGNVRVIPIILRLTTWEKSPFGKLQALPTNAKPVTSWHNQDEAYISIAEGIKKVAVNMIMKNLHQSTTYPLILPAPKLFIRPLILAFIIAIVLLSIVSFVMIEYSILNSWVLGGLIGGVAALIISFPISLIVINDLSKKELLIHMQREIEIDEDPNNS